MPTTHTRADLAGPGIGAYEEVKAILPDGYRALLGPGDTQKAAHALKRFIEDGLCHHLNLFHVEVPLMVRKASGLNDYHDRDRPHDPIEFLCGLGLAERMECQVVQTATKWNRMALTEFECRPGEGICTDTRAIRRDYFLDHDHSAYVDQWDWEKVIRPEQRTLSYLKETVRAIWDVLTSAERYIQRLYPALRDPRYPGLPKEITFLHAEEILDLYPDLPRKDRETRVLQQLPAIFIIGIGWTLDDGHPHDVRAADYDDWATPTLSDSGRRMHGLNGDIVVWNPVTRRRHELMSMGIRVTKDTLRQQLAIAGQEQLLQLPYHQAILNDAIPLSIGGGLGQSRTVMLLLRKAHLGEVSVSVWPTELTSICEAKHIHVLV